jgi:uncharacterized protein with HEPN domain
VSRGDDLRIADIVAAADDLATLVGRGRDAFDADPFLQRAAERLLEIIGEAAKAVSDETRAQYPDVEWSKAAQLRDLLIHGYHRIDPAQVWATAANHVPSLAHGLRAGPADP